MPPKKYNKKTKSKRYSCELCVEIDNKWMIQCGDCQSKYHLKCLDIESVEENEEWICPVCLKVNSSLPAINDVRVQPNSKNSQIEMVLQNKSQANGSKSNDSNIEPGLQTNNRESHKSNDKDDRSKKTQSEDPSQHTGRRSQNTRSSIGRRAQIELDRIEEEKQLKEKRDKEYLDSKYRTLLKNCSNKSERTGSEKRSTDRSSFTREWVQGQQISNAQPPNKSQIPPMVEREYAHVNDIHRFKGRIDDITFDNTSPLDPNAARDSTRNLNSQMAAAVSKQNSNSPERNRIQSSTMHCIRNSLETQNTFNGKRVPCAVHDARQFMFQDRGTSNQFGNVGVPISNSTFAPPQVPNDNTIGDQRRNRDVQAASQNSTDHHTLEWDNFFDGAALRKYLNRQDPSQVKSKEVPEKIGKPKSSVLNMESEFEDREPNERRNKVDDTVYISDDESSTFNRQSTSNQTERKVKFNESRKQNQHQKPNPSSLLNVEHQLSTSYAPTSNANGAEARQTNSQGRGAEFVELRREAHNCMSAQNIFRRHCSQPNHARKITFNEV